MIRERKRLRLEGYDYSRNGFYFVTICIKRRTQNWFGEIVEGRMILNEYGKIIQKQWEWLFSQYGHLVKDEFVIMPNHVHGIVVIAADGGLENRVGTRDGGEISPQKPKPLPQIMGAFKTTSSKLIHQEGLSVFQWQKSYYDRIIRDEIELFNVRNYIKNNPMNWEIDQDQPDEIHYFDEE